MFYKELVRMSVRQELGEGARFSFWWVLVILLLFGSIAGGWWLFTRPNVDRGYAAQIGGLVTAYCTAPNPTEREHARGDIVAQRDSASARWDRLTPSARSRAQQVIDRNPEVCQ